MALSGLHLRCCLQTFPVEATSSAVRHPHGLTHFIGHGRKSLICACVCVCVCVCVCFNCDKSIHKHIHLYATYMYHLPFYVTLKYAVQCCCCYCLASRSCPTLCDHMDCSPPGSSGLGISQVRILEWGAVSFSRGSSPSRDRTCVSCTGRWTLYH